MRFFNTAGPINPEDHYYVPHRFNEQLFLELIQQKKYFILHAPRQSGKTTAIRVFTQQLNDLGVYKALYINVEPAQIARSNVENGMKIIIRELRGAAQLSLKSDDPLFAHIEEGLLNISGSSLKEVLQAWSLSSDKPIILFIDEIDSLVGDTLISVLRQLRAGYTNRPRSFPQSVCLIGVRDVRDYRIWSDADHNMVLGGSAFNIKAESLVLSNFSLEQVRSLYGQHTQETGQQFADDAVEYAFYLTQGQPWLVNALAYQACFRDVTDRSQPITKEVIERSKETLILRRDTHIDVLVDRLKEPRVCYIIDAIISGAGEEQDFKTDDLQYVRDLGLLSLKGAKIANPIYQEVIPRELAYSKQETIAQETAWYVNADGSFNMHKMIEAFVRFYRQNSDIWLGKFDYKESGPHILLMAFLQRVINGGGKIHREYALGRGRVDIFVEWPSSVKAFAGGRQQRFVIELKIKRGEKTVEEGLKQTAGYMDINDATEGYLLVFDRNSNKPWDEKIFTQECVVGKDKITVWGM
jgi:hypothetical protein